MKEAVGLYATLKQNQKQLYITLTDASIAFSDNLITMTISNETQREQLQNMKQDLLDEIRKKLRNNLINLAIAISKTDVQSKAYKPADIFKNMAEKNPALLELKKRFDLEIEY